MSNTIRQLLIILGVSTAFALTGASVGAATPIYSGIMRLDWEAVTTLADGKPLVKRLRGYRVHYGLDSEHWLDWKRTKWVKGTATSTVLVNLPPGKWCAYVVAVGSQWETSPRSQIACKVITPSQG